MWMVANCKNGVSFYEVARALEVTQKTAWFMLHRVRYAMHNGTIKDKAEEEDFKRTPEYKRFRQLLRAVVKAPPPRKKEPEPEPDAS